MNRARPSGATQSPTGTEYARTTGMSDKDIDRAGELLASRGWDLAGPDRLRLAAVYPAKSGRGRPVPASNVLGGHRGSRFGWSVTAQQVIEISPRGVINGCRNHRNARLVRIRWTDRKRLRADLGRAEQQHPNFDLAPLFGFLIYGECSTRTLTTENP